MTVPVEDPASLAQVTEQARSTLADSEEAVLVMQVPSQTILAASPAASSLLDPRDGGVVGHRLDRFVRGEPSGGLALFADGRINGYEVSGTVGRRDGDDVRVSLWHRHYDHRSPSRFALVLLSPDADDDEHPAAPAPPVAQPAPVIGTVSSSLRIEQVSSGAGALFAQPDRLLLGAPVSTLVQPADRERWDAATAEVATGEHAVFVVVRPRADGGPEEGGPATCDVLLLPLRPGFTFIFSATEPPSSPSDPGDVRSMLSNLARAAGLARSERQRIRGLLSPDLPGLARLTARERDILVRLTSGYRVHSIAADLVLSPSTVRTHLASVFAKLGVSNQSDLLDALRSPRPDSD